MAEGRDTRRTVRCAVYTRKSTEEGLDQEFNSLHAQREAAEAYIRNVFRVWTRDWGCRYFKTDFMYFGSEGFLLMAPGSGMPTAFGSSMDQALPAGLFG